MPRSPSDSSLRVVASASAAASAAETGESVKRHRSALDCAAARDCNTALDGSTTAAIAAFYLLLTGAVTWWLTVAPSFG